MKLKLCIWWLINCLEMLQIEAHCLREMPLAMESSEASSTRHMWQQPRQPTGSCNRPTTLRLATDSNVATSQFSGNATTAKQTAATPAVTLANYVYQCAAKRESGSSKSKRTNLAKANELLP